MIVTVFRARLNPDTLEECSKWFVRMSELAKTIPGYISHKGFVAQDGEKVTIVEFEHEEGVRAWASHPEHVEAKKRARRDFFTEYRVQICSVNQDSALPQNH